MKLLARQGSRRGLRHGVAASIEHEVVAFEHAFRTVIDVGAHRGQFALFVAERFPAAELYCIEPLSSAVATLKGALAHHPRLTVFSVAAADVPGERDFHISLASDSSSLLPITEQYVTAFPGTAERTTQRVTAVPLDSLFADTPIKRPCLLKIDVQGTEHEVLTGGRQLLTAVDEIFVECSFVEFYRNQKLASSVIDLIHERGFRLEGVYSVVRDRNGRCLQADFLFIRADGH